MIKTIIERINDKRIDFSKRGEDGHCVYLGKDVYKQLIREVRPKQCALLHLDCSRLKNNEFSFCNTCCRVANPASTIETVFVLEIIRVKGERYKDYISVGIKE
jgi:Fe-S-cluster containining protein